MLEPVGLDNALKGALPVAFKTKPAERGPFAEKAGLEKVVKWRRFGEEWSCRFSSQLHLSEFCSIVTRPSHMERRGTVIFIFRW